MTPVGFQRSSWNTRIDTKRKIVRYETFMDPTYINKIPYYHKYIIVDLSDTISKYLYYPSLRELYKHFPLHDIIEMLLSISLNKSQSPCDNEFIMICTEERLGESVSMIDLDWLCILYENIVLDADLEIMAKCPSYGLSGDYVFYRWIDPVSVCFSLEERREI